VDLYILLALIDTNTIWKGVYTYNIMISTGRDNTSRTTLLPMRSNYANQQKGQDKTIPFRAHMPKQ
jgi:hypothetical protein